MKPFAVLVSLAATLVMAAAAPVAAQAPFVLLRGPAGIVTATDVEAAAQQFPLQERQARLARPQEVLRMAEDIYIRRALAAQAEKAGLQRDPLTRSLLQVGRERVLSEVQAFEIGKAVWPNDQVLEKAAREKYQASLKDYEAQARVRLRNIQVAFAAEDASKRAARERIEKLQKDLAAGADFAELARRESMDPATASAGGDMGYVPVDTLRAEFQPSVAKLAAASAVSDIVETANGFHLFKLEDRRSAGVQPFEEVRDALMDSLRFEIGERARRKAVESIRSGIKLDEKGVRATANRFATSPAK